MYEQRNIKITDPELTNRASTEGEDKFIIGYAALYNSESRMLTEKINGRDVQFYETIRSGAFDKADISDVIYVIDHDPSRLVGRTGANLTVQITDRGLFFKNRVIDTQESRDLYTAVNEKLYVDNSFRFKVKNDTWERRQGMLYRSINEIERIVDVSTTLKGSYAEPFLFTRSLDESLVKEIDVNKDDDYEYYLRTTEYLKKTA